MLHAASVPDAIEKLDQRIITTATKHGQSLGLPDPRLFERQAPHFGLDVNKARFADEHFLEQPPSKSKKKTTIFVWSCVRPLWFLSSPGGGSKLIAAKSAAADIRQ